MVISLYLESSPVEVLAVALLLTHPVCTDFTVPGMPATVLRRSKSAALVGVRSALLTAVLAAARDEIAASSRSISAVRPVDRLVVR
jgi:hypothetical protein